MFGVWDGHGPTGEFDSKLARDAANTVANKIYETRILEWMPDNLRAASGLDFVQPASASSVPAELSEADLKGLIEFTNTTLLNTERSSKYEVDCGTTALVGLFTAVKGGNVSFEKRADRSHLVVANVGDSRAAIFHANENRNFPNLPKKGKFVTLSEDHDLTKQKELDRIKQCGGVVIKPKSNSKRVYPPKSDVTWEQVKKRSLSLNMSRSLGHCVLSKYGISPTPEFNQVTIVSEGDIVVFASDGLWDIVEQSEIEKMVASASDSGIAVNDLCRQLMKRVFQGNGKYSAENTTIIVVKVSKADQEQSAALPPSSVLAGKKRKAE